MSWIPCAWEAKVIKLTVAVFSALLVAACATGGSRNTTVPATAPTAVKSISAAAAAPTGKKGRLEGIPLVWKPTLTLAKAGAIDVTGLSNVRLQVTPVTDARSGSAFIGQNIEKKEPRFVSTPENVAAFVNDHMKQLISGAGIPVVGDGGSAILTTELQQFFVEEKDDYIGDVRANVTLTDRGGKILWTAVVNGTSSHFGRSYKAENYYETLSDSIQDLVLKLLQNPGFHSALAGTS